MDHRKEGKSYRKPNNEYFTEAAAKYRRERKKEKNVNNKREKKKKNKNRKDKLCR